MRHGDANRVVRRIHEVFGLPGAVKEELDEVAQVFPFQATEYYLSLIDWDDPDDPIRRIIIPDPAELHGLEEATDFDPSAEALNLVAPGVQHKYPDTALIMLSNCCAGLCRYCFRKRLFLRGGERAAHAREIAHDPAPALNYIRAHPVITNVLLTGGDPLVLPTALLGEILDELRSMEHIGVIRIGTRVPVFDPHRVLLDPELLRVLRAVSTPTRRVVIVTHFDHPREITPESTACIAQFIDNGIPVLNQHPLAAGVNDDPDVLVELYRLLTAMGVSNYYLFIIRPTAGNRSFQVPLTRAFGILRTAKLRLSGIEKRLRLAMSHASGKIEIVGVDENHIYLKYHRARNRNDVDRMLVCRRDDSALWLDDLVPVESMA